MLPAQRGRAPEVHVRKIFMPPVAVIRNENPKLVVEQALLTSPDFNISAANIGDPAGTGLFAFGRSGRTFRLWQRPWGRVSAMNPGLGFHGDASKPKRTSHPATAIDL